MFLILGLLYYETTREIGLENFKIGSDSLNKACSKEMLSLPKMLSPNKSIQLVNSTLDIFTILIFQLDIKSLTKHTYDIDYTGWPKNTGQFSKYNQYDQAKCLLKWHSLH